MADVVPFKKMDAPRALEIIRKAAGDTSLIDWTVHATKQMRRRKISPAQVLSCLEKGVLVEGPYLDVKGGWRCALQRLAAGEEVKVSVAIVQGPRVVVITAMD